MRGQTGSCELWRGGKSGNRRELPRCGGGGRKGNCRALHFSFSEIERERECVGVLIWKALRTATLYKNERGEVGKMQ